MKHQHFGVLLTVLLLGSMSSPASAQTICGTVSSAQIGSGNDTVVLGVGLDFLGYDNFTHTCIYGNTHSPAQLGACIDHGSGSMTYYTSVAACTTGSSQDYVEVDTGAGNDTVEPAPASPSYIACGGTPDSHGCYQHAVADCNFTFGISSRLGTGNDIGFGSPRHDAFYSNTDFIPPFTIYPADAAADLICGFGGNDILAGDFDNSSSANECIYGGAATDECDLINSGGTYYDRGGVKNDVTHTGDCETGDGASHVTQSPDWCFSWRAYCSEQYTSVPYVINW